ncbi:UbiD family decarboxylase domain-containing protein [Streptomyces albus]|uniref:UbiD family decarboxylase domain-containing protein n=1 Tax=Streptomyces albus TaxID=1888 RepID=UPI00370310C1
MPLTRYRSGPFARPPVAAAGGRTRPSAAGRHGAGGHPLLLLAASARVGADVDERDLADGPFGTPLEVVRTPRYGIRVPASAELAGGQQSRRPGRLPWSPRVATL